GVRDRRGSDPIYGLNQGCSRQGTQREGGLRDTGADQRIEHLASPKGPRHTLADVHCLHIAVGWRHRDHEHHAGHGDRANARNRCAASPWRHPGGHHAPVSRGNAHALPHRRWHRSGRRLPLRPLSAQPHAHHHHRDRMVGPARFRPFCLHRLDLRHLSGSPSGPSRSHRGLASRI
ncbi:uncharacterized protein METZ01_LOCUS273707, partial [marine metagenome]